jgi:hypothetical protein
MSHDIGKPVNDGTITNAVPKVVQDPRFRGGRTLIQTGHAAQAIEIFASLLEGARATFGEASIETAPTYYEYGNALLREAIQTSAAAAVHEDDDAQDDDDDCDDEATKQIAAATTTQNARQAAALAAEKRRQQTNELDQHDQVQDQQQQQEEDRKPAAKQSTNQEEKEEASVEEEEEEEEEDTSDVELALEMMETAWSIVDQYIVLSEKGGSKTYLDWANEQSPRYLTGIGESLSTLQKHGDAIGAYSRALERRTELLKHKFDIHNKSSTDFLKCRRLIVENNILIAEEFLACPDDKDVVSTETNTILVQAGNTRERIDYAKTYYEKSREELQETVLLMGEMTAKGIPVADEKEDICFASTLVMGVGMRLAELEEALAQSNNSPQKKKAKLG